MTVLKSFLFSSFLAFLVYLAGCFMNAEFNIALWGEISRVCIAFGMLLFFAIGLIATSENL